VLAVATSPSVCSRASSVQYAEVRTPPRPTTATVPRRSSASPR
jgi:hypothetical protein